MRIKSKNKNKMTIHKNKNEKENNTNKELHPHLGDSQRHERLPHASVNPRVAPKIKMK